MNIATFYETLVEPFEKVWRIFIPDNGYIVWRLGTGGNIELLHIRVFELRKGYATMLVRMMLEELKQHPPYHSVFGFAVASKPDIGEIYRHLGFETETIVGMYQSGGTIVFHQEYAKLCTHYDIPHQQD